MTASISRRRVLLLGISGLTVLATLPVVGHHLLGSQANLLDGRDNIGNLCLVALHQLLAPVHYGFHLALIAGFIYAAVDRIRAWTRLRGATGQLRLEMVPEKGLFAEALADAGAGRHQAVLVRGLPNPAFTAGWWKPKIFLNPELACKLNRAELRLVVAHEVAHLRRRDPLRLAVLRFFACLVFWLPALRRLAEDVADEAEFEADDISGAKQPLVLASAILSVALWSPATRPLQDTAAFVQPDLIEQRVRRLSGERLPPRSHVTARSLAAAAIMLVAALTSGVVMAHPLPSPPAGSAVISDGDRTHGEYGSKCAQHQGPALLHLFCKGVPGAPRAADCPSHVVTTTL